MALSLNEWDARLRKHFAELHLQRGTKPLFALEHGLEPDDIENLNIAIRNHVRVHEPSWMHSLVWIVYAAEIGYGYSGDEYWQTFESKTPGWAKRGSRDWIRERFATFSEQFGGAAPKGAWASHFTIICWPITHAILPLDLQRQLAQILYDLRHSFSAELFESPGTLGQVIARRSWSATSRFQNLAEESQLIGQIATALLLQGVFGSSSLLHPAALKRISNDLDRERIARGWLRTARKVAQEQATVRLPSPLRSGILPSRTQSHEVRPEGKTLNIEPSLVLRPKDVASSSWQAYLIIPELSHLLTRFPSLREVLTQSRCAVAGSAGRPIARGQCLFGSQQVLLKRWPRQNEVIMQFDKRDSQLEALLRTECLLRSGPTWLFRIGSDGLAYEARTLRAQPGHRYILVRSGLVNDPELLPIALACEGVTGHLIVLPEVIDLRWESILKRLGIRQSKGIEVWPAGLPPAQWDSDGRGEWLASERPCLGIRADHSVSAIIVRIGVDGSLPLVIDNLSPGEIAFVELPQLPLGLHTIRLSTRRCGQSGGDPVSEPEVLIRIREHRQWSVNGGLRGPLHARVEPLNPTLEELWEGTAEISFQGPNGRQLKCTASLLDSMLESVKTVHLPSLPLPVEGTTWSRHFRRWFQSQKGIADAYDSAKACELVFSADELGSYTLRCSRESTPLRWSMRRNAGRYELRLLDDSGPTGSAKVSRRSFERPQLEDVLPENPVYIVPPAGGLYLARASDRIASIVAPPMIDGLEQLGCEPLLKYSSDTRAALLAAWRDAELWTNAKPAGEIFSLARQFAVRMAIHRYSIQLLCGNEWSTVETGYDAGCMSINYLQRAIWKTNQESEIAERLRRNYDAISGWDMLTRIREMAWVAKLLERPNSIHAGTEYDWIAEFALRVVSDSSEVTHWAGNRLTEATEFLLRFPTFVRAARFMVVCTDKELRSEGFSRELYRTWRWR